MRKCPVLGCKFNKNPQYADSFQIKRHLQYNHDYREKQETAFSLGLINFIDERRSSTWLVDSLFDFSSVEKYN
ncbi:MAG: hypothetical protein COA77_06625 [Thaumarchaeota archaeon]|nr:MAG: hypothetical protein COA77_06625 [Nitrososphaerota archaeon]